MVKKKSAAATTPTPAKAPATKTAATKTAATKTAANKAAVNLHTKPEPPASKSTQAPAQAAAQAPAQRNLASEQIGEVAGMIWERLNEQGEQSIAAIKSSLDVPADLVMAAIGWLAREDKLVFNTSGRSVLLSLLRNA